MMLGADVIAMPIAFNASVLNNFVVERAAFTGVEIGICKVCARSRVLAYYGLCFWFCVNKPLLCSPWRCWVWALQLLILSSVWSVFHHGADEYWFPLL